MKRAIFILWLFIIPVAIVALVGWFFSTGSLKIGGAALLVAYIWIITAAPAIRYIQNKK